MKQYRSSVFLFAIYIVYLSYSIFTDEEHRTLQLLIYSTISGFECAAGRVLVTGVLSVCVLLKCIIINCMCPVI